MEAYRRSKAFGADARQLFSFSHRLCQSDWEPALFFIVMIQGQLLDSARTAGIETMSTNGQPRTVATSSCRQLNAQCCIVGGGPAGMMLGFLMGRAGVETIVIEKHADFLHDFRGDTVHPSTLQIMDELGLLAEFLKRPHQTLSSMQGQFGRTFVRVADFAGLNLKCPYIVFMPQWDFLDFLFEKSAHFPTLKVLRRTEATELLWEDDTIVGVRAESDDGPIEIRATLTIGCDGRHSTVRRLAGLEIENIGAPIDVLWFRVGKATGATDGAFMHAVHGRILVTLDRGDYWQCAYVFPKGQIDAVKARGLDAFRHEIAATAPHLKDRTADVKTWDDVKLLTVTVDRLRRWTRPGLLCIGDAAHAMSPVGGVGINLAIQDAVATANILAPLVSQGRSAENELDQVRRRRLFPTKVTQALQVEMHNRILSPALEGRDLEAPFLLRLINALPWLQRMTARLLGVGVRPEHVRSPAVPLARAVR
jgi:2-polyprenyl-6-methoxyphenol hydroxylase-like FAD-dependent oxidoreductase